MIAAASSTRFIEETVAGIGELLADLSWYIGSLGDSRPVPAATTFGATDFSVEQDLNTNAKIPCVCDSGYSSQPRNYDTTRTEATELSWMRMATKVETYMLDISKILLYDMSMQQILYREL